MTRTFAVLLGLCVLSLASCSESPDAYQSSPVAAAQQPSDGIGVVILCDVSGSMSEDVSDGDGHQARKCAIASAALQSVVERLADFVACPSNRMKNISAELLAFGDSSVTTVIPMRQFNRKAFLNAIRGLPSPSGGTPIGRAMEKATKDLFDSGLTRKHVIVITDGDNTAGPAQGKVLPQIQADASKMGTSVAFHFVAFDTDARDFDQVKKLGATVESASNGAQLKERLGYILEYKILLENEEPPPEKGR